MFYNILKYIGMDGRIVFDIQKEIQKILTEEMGSSCRICSRRNCMGRREPSILGEEF